jgi:hypothetical protein
MVPWVVSIPPVVVVLAGKDVTTGVEHGGSVTVVRTVVVVVVKLHLTVSNDHDGLTSTHIGSIRMVVVMKLMQSLTAVAG